MRWNPWSYKQQLESLMATIDDKEYKAEQVLQAILSRPIQWVDWRSMPKEARKRWGSSAKQLLDNEVFIALCGKIEKDGKKTNGELVKNLIEDGIRYAKDYETLKDVRMTINGIELIREKVEEMLFNEQEETYDSINDAI